MTQNIIFFCAHPDDETIGPGGTIAKYIQEKKKVIIVLFTDGEASHPWQKKHVVTKRRRIEISKSAKILGAHKIYHLGLNDGKLRQNVNKPIVKDVILDILGKFKPTKIFTHDEDDVIYSDHVAVNKIVLAAVDEYNLKSKTQVEAYTFNIWAITMRKRNSPQLFVDITDTFAIKMEALKCFPSQRLALLQLWPTVLAKAMLYGFQNNTKYAERFYKVR